jgi:hypothetical protein
MTRQFDAIIVGAEQGVGTVPTCGSAAFGVFSGRRCHRHRLRRRHPPTSSDIGFAPESAGVHPLLAAGHRGAMAARVEAAWKFIENYTQYKSVWIDLY